MNESKLNFVKLLLTTFYDDIMTPTRISFIATFLLIILTLPVIKLIFILTSRKNKRKNYKFSRSKILVNKVKYGIIAVFFAIAIALFVSSIFEMHKLKAKEKGLKEDIENIWTSTSLAVEGSIRDVEYEFLNYDKLIAFVDSAIYKLLNPIFIDYQDGIKETEKIFAFLRQVKNIVYFYSEYPKQLEEYKLQNSKFAISLDNAKGEINMICYQNEKLIQKLCDSIMKTNFLFTEDLEKIDKLFEKSILDIENQDLIYNYAPNVMGKANEILSYITLLDDRNLMGTFMKSVHKMLRNYQEVYKGKIFSYYDNYVSKVNIAITSVAIFVPLMLIVTFMIVAVLRWFFVKKSIKSKRKLSSVIIGILMTLLYVFFCITFVLSNVGLSNITENQNSLKYIDERIIYPILKERFENMASKVKEKNIDIKQFIQVPKSVLQIVFGSCRKSVSTNLFTEIGFYENFDIIGLLRSENITSFVDTFIKEFLKKHNNDITTSSDVMNNVIKFIQRMITSGTVGKLLNFEFHHQKEIKNFMKTQQNSFKNNLSQLQKEFKIFEKDYAPMNFKSSLSSSVMHSSNYQTLEKSFEILSLEFDKIQKSRRELIKIFVTRKSLNTLIQKLLSKKFIIRKLLDPFTNYNYRKSIFENFRTKSIPGIIHDTVSWLEAGLKRLTGGFQSCYDISYSLRQIIRNVFDIVYHVRVWALCIFGLCGTCIVLLYPLFC